MRRAEVTSIDLTDDRLRGERPHHHREGRPPAEVPHQRRGTQGDQRLPPRGEGRGRGLLPELPGALPARCHRHQQPWPLSPSLINELWNEVCLHRPRDRPYPALRPPCHGRPLVKKTGNPRAAQRQLGHKTPPPPCSTCSSPRRRCRWRWMTGRKRAGKHDALKSGCHLMW